MLSGPLRAWVFFVAGAYCLGAEPSGVEFFETRIRPLLAAKCYACHSSKTTASGGLRLDAREPARKGGQRGPAVVPGEADLSLLLRAVSFEDAALKMPPSGKLSAREITDLAEWIRMGAPDPRDETAPAARRPNTDHWAFQPFRAHPAPRVKNRRWAASWIDNFLLARLEEKKLAPAPPAARRTLIRRVTYDLIGLPPTPAEIDAFLRDTSPRAFEKVVDRLLASPHYGERWARHWLDLARYAETDGHEFDREKPNAWRYRDYVIRAFNEDLPFDRFVHEQVAGDLLPPRTLKSGLLESPVGTTFFALGEERNAADDLGQVRADKIDNQIDTLGKTFVGLTIACARCHDHKFDPISTREYYALAGVLESKRVVQAWIDAPERREETERLHAEILSVNRRAAAEFWKGQRGQARGTAQYLLAAAELLMHCEPDPPKAATQRGLDAALLTAWLGELQQAVEEPDHALHPLARLAQLSDEPYPARAAALRQSLAAWMEKARDEVVIADFSKGSYEGWRTDGPAFGAAPAEFAPPQQTLAGYQARPLANSFGGGADELTGFLTSRSFRAEKKFFHVRLAGGLDLTSARQPPQLRVSLVGDGRDLGISPGGSRRLVWKSAGLGRMLGETVFVEIADRSRDKHLVVDKIVLSDSRTPPVSGRILNGRVMRLLEDAAIGSLEQLAGAYESLLEAALSAPEVDADARWLAHMITTVRAAHEQAPGPAELESSRAALAAKLPESAYGLISIEDVPRDAPVFISGNHRNPGETVQRGFLRLLGEVNEAAWRKGSGRAALAEALTGANNPLTARVIVNRVWKHHFGEGLVRTVDNFGHTGERPAHPELLDTLAARFVENGWRLKPLHREIVLSSAYRMSNRKTAAAMETDPDNRLLHHFPIRRLDAEIIRDAMLAVSGALDRTLYGPSVPPHVSEYQDGRGKPVSGPVDGKGRRSIYIGVRRNFLPPLFVAFDYPMTVTAIGRRGTSAVPSQALILMNNEFVAGQATRWADALSRYRNGRSRVQAMYRSAFGRPATNAEIARCLGFVAAQRQRHSDNQAEFRAWTDLAHALFNTKEFIFVQ
jgi:hypothetical protein